MMDTRRSMQSVLIKFTLILLILSNGFSYAQVSNKKNGYYEPLSVGDIVPDYSLINLINYNAKTAGLYDFKGKLVILYFWSTYCASCIESFPKLEALQKEFSREVQIILVNTVQDESIVRQVFEKRKKLTGIEITLPTVCGDTVLAGKLFKYRGVPHVVWVDKNSYVKHFTHGDVLNSKNVKSILNNEELDIHQKTALDLTIDYTKPLFFNGNGGNGEKLIGNSVLSHYIDGLPNAFGLFADQKTGYSIVAINQSIQDLYRYAYSNRVDKYGTSLAPIPLSRIILEVKDKSAYTFQVEQEIQWKTLYTYQLTSPPTTQKKMQEMMREDLKRYFNLETRWERRVVKCLVLTADDTLLIKPKGGALAFMVTDVEVKLNKVPMTFFVKDLEDASKYSLSPYPIIDETRYKGLIGGIDFAADVNDYRSLDKALQKYKMNFKLESREIDVLVISEPQFRNSEYNKTQ
jgi:thiol-disulfide isomerase/thioredoxin